MTVTLTAASAHSMAHLCVKQLRAGVVWMLISRGPAAMLKQPGLYTGGRGHYVAL